jgi:Rha family phage regulatory protein
VPSARARHCCRLTRSAVSQRGYTATSTEPVAVDGKVFANSQDVAEFFGKRHDHVLRDVDSLISTPPSLGALGYFSVASYLDAKGEKRRAFDMTRDGFTLLGMVFSWSTVAPVAATRHEGLRLGGKPGIMGA